MARNKPFSRTEMKILVYNKMKRGLSYEQAVKEVKQIIEQCTETSKSVNKKKNTSQEC